MNHFKLLFLSLIVASLACTPQPVSTTLSDAQMAAIMAELMLSEGATVMINGYKRDSIAAVYYEEVFVKQRTSKQEYEENLRILVGDIDRMERIMTESERILKERQALLPATQ